MNNESRTNRVNNPGKAKTAAVFLVCLIIPALIGWAGCMLSGMTSFTAVKAPYIPGGVVSTIIWAACYALLGLSLFLIITADARNKNQRIVKMWSLSLWGAMFTLSLIWPFLMFAANAYMLSFVSMIITCAITVALMVVNFRLRPASAFLIIPFAVFASFLTYAAFYAAIFF